jgi:1-pyrroline-5-carboxylate dehydrogenase
MQKSLYFAPPAENEPVLTYKKGSTERENLLKALEWGRSNIVEVPMIIDGKEVKTDKKVEINPPHDHQHVLGHYYKGDESHVKDAIDAALTARKKWAALSWKQRASIFLKAAGMISGPYRARINAATMLGQSK